MCLEARPEGLLVEWVQVSLARSRLPWGRQLAGTEVGVAPSDGGAAVPKRTWSSQR